MKITYKNALFTKKKPLCFNVYVKNAAYKNLCGEICNKMLMNFPEDLLKRDLQIDMERWRAEFKI